MTILKGIVTYAKSIVHFKNIVGVQVMILDHYPFVFGMRRFRNPKSVEEEHFSVNSSVPSSTKYATKWAVTLFDDWQRERVNKKAQAEVTSFKFTNVEHFQDADTSIEEMNSESLNFWLIKFFQEVRKKNGEPYPGKTLYNIACGINRYIEEKAPEKCYNLIDRNDKRFSLCRKVLDSEMKEATKLGYGVKCKKPTREAISAEDEELLWSKGLLGAISAKTLLHTIFFYNGKLFGLRAIDHRNLRLANFTITDNLIIFDESHSKTFHGGLRDLKNTPRVTKHFCHEIGKDHQRCLVKLYKLYIEKVQNHAKTVEAFYFKPHRNETVFGYEKSPLGVHSLNKILPDELCAKGGLARKTAHSLRITTATRLFQSGVEEKLIRERTGHKSDALFKYQRPSSKQLQNASCILGAGTSKIQIESVSSHEIEMPSFEFNLLDNEQDQYFSDTGGVSDEMLAKVVMPAPSELQFNDFGNGNSLGEFLFDEGMDDDILAGIDLNAYSQSSENAANSCSEVSKTGTFQPVFNNCTFNITFK